MNDQLILRIDQAIASMPYGWCTREKATAMAKSILDRRPHICVEIGVYGGKSLIPCAMALAELSAGHILGIDPWMPDAAAEGESEKANEDWWRFRSALDQAEAQARNSIVHFGLEHVCNVVKDRGERVVQRFADGSVDFIHIDGNHTELASVRDVTGWLPKMSKGGLIWFDDINWETTKRAIAMLDEACDVVQDLNVGTVSCRLYKVR